ncbi:MAG TPA: endo-1,3-alpha-glucanase family glycosylhydrolase [Terracidiphilus sp.]
MSFFTLFHGCAGGAATSPILPLKHKAAGPAPEVLAVYEAWFGHPNHISVGYSSHDPGQVARQMKQAKTMGIDGFVVDWYGDREPFIDQSYGILQNQAGKNHFKIAMMYDETNQDDGATDEAIADLTMFHETYLSSKSAGHDAYVTYEGRPVIFIFPKGGHTDWDKVRAAVNQWNPAPLLIQENLPAKYINDFDGFYAWINPGAAGWKPDGANWGQQHLDDFYRTMGSKYPDRIVVGGAWSQFDDSKASWSLNRHMSARCGQTYRDTFDYWRKVFPANDPPPFLLVETWNDHEEGTAIEGGIPNCGTGSQAPLSQGGH